MTRAFAYVQHYEKPLESLLPPRCWIVIRLDGNRFTPFTRQLQKPVDERLRRIFTYSVRDLLMKENDLCMGYCQSDEISFVVRRNSDWFGRRKEKILSHVATGYTSHFTKRLIENQQELNVQDPCVQFDAKVSCLHDWRDLRAYLRWRQWNGWSNYVSGLLHYSILAKGMNPREADTRVDAANIKQKIRMLREEFGVDANLDPPEAHRNGVSFICKLKDNTTGGDSNTERVILERTNRYSDNAWCEGDDFDLIQYEERICRGESV